MEKRELQIPAASTRVFGSINRVDNVSDLASVKRFQCWRLECQAFVRANQGIVSCIWFNSSEQWSYAIGGSKVSRWERMRSQQNARTPSLHGWEHWSFERLMVQHEKSDGEKGELFLAPLPRPRLRLLCRLPSIVPSRANTIQVKLDMETKRAQLSPDTDQNHSASFRLY